MSRPVKLDVRLSSHPRDAHVSVPIAHTAPAAPWKDSAHDHMRAFEMEGRMVAYMIFDPRTGLKIGWLLSYWQAQDT
jgi:hypothetical protein